MPKVGEFIAKACGNHGCKLTTLPHSIQNDSGSSYEVRSLSRSVDGKKLTYALANDDSDVMTPSLLRSICARLEMPIEDFGLNLG